MPTRRDFLSRATAAAAVAAAFDADELRAASTSHADGPWDTSWIERVERAKFRVVFNATDIADGAALDLTSTFFSNYNEAHGTPDAQMRPVVVFRRLGTCMAFNDSVWERYPVAEDRGVKDPVTKAFARRNIFWKGPDGVADQYPDSRIERLMSRGMIALVCNVAVNNIGKSMADKMQRDVEEVRKDIKANLVPGAILVPSGVYAMIRAQNAGCAYMPGT